jgi:hypothetical protein
LSQKKVKRFRVLGPLEEVTAEVRDNQMVYAGPESLGSGVDWEYIFRAVSLRYGYDSR